MQYALATPPGDGRPSTGRLRAALLAIAVIGLLLGLLVVSTGLTLKPVDDSDVIAGAVLLLAGGLLLPLAFRVVRIVPDPMSWTAEEALAGILAAMILFQFTAAVAQGLVGAIVGIPTGNHLPDLAQAIGSAVSQMIAYLGMAGGGLLLLLRHRGVRPARLGLRWPRPLYWLLAGPVVAGLGLLVTGEMQSLQQRIWPGVSSTQCQDVSSAYGTYVAVVVIVVCVMAPLFEETFFRGFVHTGLRSQLPLPQAALASGLLFALFHLQPVLIPELWVFGVLQALLYERTRSLIPGMISHALFNLPGAIVLIQASGHC